ncbi:MAG: DUF1565 domain-containing protein, partial [Deltaproteobacteria bacterium]|nr:DUF1565 domain-containing protein [Deltaproteobacteria bacterium]
MLARSLAHLPSLSLPLVVALVGLACGSSFTTAPFGDATSGAGGTAPTGSSQGGSSGDGGAPCDASDADEDGLSVCEGDCDDANPLVNPSASEICGDLVRNDCKGGGDPVECGGKGTFVATAIGKDTNPGTKTAPLKTVEAGMKSAASLKNGQAVYVAAGDYEPVTHPVISPRFSLREGTSLLGGYRCDSAECTWSRDAKQHVTTLKMSDGVGLFANVGITDKTVVEGFTIVGQDGSAVVNTFRTTVELEGAPTIRGNVIRGPSVGPSGGSVA